MTIKSEMEAKMGDAWNYIWGKLFVRETGLFYDYITSYEEGKGLDHLPFPAEIKLQTPNALGWRTGMEDSMINGGCVMGMLCDRFAATGEKELATYAADAFKGLVACAEIHGKKGFLVRSISPRDKKSYYINSSIDQYTMYIYGLWRFFHSALSNAEQKKKIIEIFTGMAAYFEQTVTKENDYNFLRLDGFPGLYSRLWGSIDPHEVARLPMAYAAAWDVSGDRHWFDMYRRYAEEAVRRALKIDASRPLGAFAALQMQCSQWLIHAVEKDEAIRNLYLEAMNVTAHIAEWSMIDSANLFEELKGDLSALNCNWRKAVFVVHPNYNHDLSSHGNVPFFYAQYPEKFAKAFSSVKESGESALIQLLCPGRRMSAKQLALFQDAIARVDYKFHSSYGPIGVLCGYWRARALKAIE